MKNLHFKILTILVSSSALSLTSVEATPNAPGYTYAIPTQSDNGDITVGDATDLILEGTNSLSGYTYLSSLGQAANASQIVQGADLNDGLADSGNGLGGDEYTANGYVTYTFDLNTNTNPLDGPVGSADGYTINTLDLYSGYNGGFQQQYFTVKLETTTSMGFVTLGTYSNQASTELFTDPTNPNTGYFNQVNRTEISDSTGIIATNVIAVELINSSVVNKEFQVLGVPTVSLVPEPSTWAMLLGGLGFLGFWLRRRKA